MKNITRRNKTVIVTVITNEWHKILTLNGYLLVSWGLLQLSSVVGSRLKPFAAGSNKQTTDVNYQTTCTADYNYM